jgi:preprotein translocase subunit YajC
MKGAEVGRQYHVKGSGGGIATVDDIKSGQVVIILGSGSRVLVPIEDIWAILGDMVAQGEDMVAQGEDMVAQAPPPG